MINLTDEQKQIIAYNPVEHDTDVLVACAPGSGKTTTMALWVINQIARDALKPENIVYTTFSRAGVESVSDKIKELTDGEAGFEPRISTIHSLAWKVVQKSEDKLTAISEEDIKTIANDVIDRLHPELGKSYKKYYARNIPPLVDHALSRLEDIESMDWKSFMAYAGQLWTAYKGRDSIPGNENVFRFGHKVVKEVGKVIRTSGYVTFSEMLPRANALIDSDSSYANAFANVKVIVLDEAQDTSVEQFEFLYRISKLWGTKLIIVGDDDQSIYGWRGAHSTGMSDFKHKRNPVVFNLSVSWRCPDAILRVASSIVEKGYWERIPKQIKTNRPNEGCFVYAVAPNSQSMGKKVVQRVVQVKEKTGKFSSAAILCRSNLMMEGVCNVLTHYGIPWKSPVEKKYKEWLSYKLISGIVSLLLNPYDYLSFERVARFMPRVGTKTIEKIFIRVSSGEKVNLAEWVRGRGEIYDKLFDTLNEVISNTEPSINSLVGIYDLVVSSKGFQVKHKELKPFEHPSRYREIERIGSMSSGLKDLVIDKLPVDMWRIFVMGLDSGMMEGDDAGVSVMTIHASKGLEWDYVIIPTIGADDFKQSTFTRLIDAKTLIYEFGDDFDEMEAEEVWHALGAGKPERVEIDGESERLLYVALTRAKKGVAIIQPASIDIYAFSKGVPEKRQKKCHNIGYLNSFEVLPNGVGTGFYGACGNKQNWSAS